MNIFIVEDDSILMLMLNRMVAKLGCTVIGSAQEGSEAIKKIKEQNPDLILLDIYLKDNIDGIKVAREIKKKKNYPIIYITGNSDSSKKFQAEEIGYHDYLCKPTTFQELSKSIRSFQKSYEAGNLFSN